MKREEIKTYKDACKVIGRKPRTYKDKHLNLYEQLSTITAALNFISNNNKPWEPKFDYYYIYSWLYRRSGYNKSAGVFHLFSNYGLDPSPARVGTSLKIKEREDGNYIIENFKELLQDWFWGD
jgi:hypothetical protein|nr:MAG TPA: hypothetical protein [Caudoviricetes sp.]